MTSLYGNDPIWDYNIAQDIQDLYSPPKGFQPVCNTISGIIYNNPEFSIYKFLLEKSGLIKDYDDLQENCTLLIVSDENIRRNYNNTFNENTFLNMSRLTARELLLYNTLPGKINYNALTSSPIARLMTKIDNFAYSTLFLKLYGNDYVLNNISRILDNEIIACNGIIHQISNLLIPETMQGVIINK